MDVEQLALRLAALGQASRLALIGRIATAGARGLTPGALAEAEGLAPNLVSHHLRPLMASGLLVAEKVGRTIVYRVEPGALTAVAGELLGLAARSAR